MLERGQLVDLDEVVLRFDERELSVTALASRQSAHAADAAPAACLHSGRFTTDEGSTALCLLFPLTIRSCCLRRLSLAAKPHAAIRASEMSSQ